jgi:hypothetical protein
MTNEPKAPKPDAKGPQAAADRHEQRKGWFIAEAHRQAANRARMARCEAFYDGEQWRYDEAEEVRDRGQNPVVYNEVKPTIDWLIGTERRTRVDFTVIPDTDDEGASDDAATKTKLLKWLDDTNRAHFERSWAAEEAFKAGLGWLEVGVRGDRTDAPVMVAAESWRNILWDSNARRRDLSDARYIFRVKVIDLDVAEAIFPTKKRALQDVAQDGDAVTQFAEWGLDGTITGLDQFSQPDEGNRINEVTANPVDLFNARKRVLLLECWSREPVPRKATAEGMGDPVEFRMRVSIMTERETLIEDWSPYRHNRFPFVPVWAYINRRTGLPYSPIWPLIGPQEALNHRMSKSLFEASSNQVMLEKSAIDADIMDADELRTEFNSPDGMPIFANGALSGNKVKDRQNEGRAERQLMLAERDITTIRGMSGVTGENRGLETRALSGKAVLAKQDQGSLVTAELFDHLLLARNMEGELTLSLAEQFVVQPMTIRLPGATGAMEQVHINQPQPGGGYLNDITQRRSKFVIGEQAWKQAYAESAFEQLFELLTQLSTAAPQVVVNLLDLVFSMHPNLPKKDAIVARMRALNGQTDPEGKLTPEQQVQKDKRDQMEALEQEVAVRTAAATIAELEAKGRNAEATAIKTHMDALAAAVEAAVALGVMPSAAPVADELVRSAGFHDQGTAGMEQVIDLPVSGPNVTAAQAIPPQLPAQAQAQMQQEQPGAAGAPEGAAPGAPINPQE